MPDYLNVRTAIGLCTAIGILLGALLQNVVLWLCIGAGLGAVLGAISVNKKPRDEQFINQRDVTI